MTRERFYLIETAVSPPYVVAEVATEAEAQDFASGTLKVIPANSPRRAKVSEAIERWTAQDDSAAIRHEQELVESLEAADQD